MRGLAVLALIVSGITMLYKWRYRIANMLLAISFLRRIAVKISMNMPTIRNKILPGLFNRPTN